MADGPFGRQVRAGPVGASSLAGEPDRQQQPVSVTGPQVDVEHLVHPLDPRPGKVWNEAGRLAESKLDEPGRHLCGVDRLKSPDPVHRALDSLAGGQIADRELDAILGLVAAPTEHPHLAVGLAQERHDEAPERAGATGDQN